jgi:hypothetical protein
MGNRTTKKHPATLATVTLEAEVFDMSGQFKEQKTIPV